MTPRNAHDPERGRIVLTAGGTGGHMFPAIALANELIGRGGQAVLFTDERGARYADRVPGLDSVVVPSASPSRGGILGKMGFAFTLMRGSFVAGRALRRHAATGVVGFGGYAAFPACFAAARQKRPLILHEQNAHLGLANRMLRGKADAIALSFDRVAGLPETGSRVINTGNPVRPEIIAVGRQPYRAPGKTEKLRLLILGGSQGARVFSDVVPEALTSLREVTRTRIEVTQQCRPEDLDRVETAYAAMGLDATLATFFDDMPERLAASHLLICRSGASTVAEVLAAGRPAIFVPYPHAADDHQTANAREMEAEGAGWLLPQREFTAEALAARLSDALERPEILLRAADSAQRIAKPDAAARLADLVEAVIQERVR